jgi:hypothetical protein
VWGFFLPPNNENLVESVGSQSPQTVDCLAVRFDRCILLDDHQSMKRLDFTDTIDALTALEDADVPVGVDDLVDAFLIGFEPTRITTMRRELAREFLAAAPFRELSYRIWQRIARDDEDSYAQAYMNLRRPSQRFLPTVDFHSPGSAHWFTKAPDKNAAKIGAIKVRSRPPGSSLDV